MPHKKIRAAIKEHAPKAFQSSKKKFEFRYPKLFFLGLSILLAYFLFSNSVVFSWVSGLGETNNYLGAFIAGILIAFGFSSALGVGLFIVLQPANIFLVAFIGGIGAMVSDLIIFKTIKISFEDEFNELKKTKAIMKIRSIVKENKHVLIKHYLLYAFAGIMIVTPLPDEIGVSMLAGLTTVKVKVLAIAGFILHALTIFLILRFF
ncbi:MAG: hypothetical protein ABIH28_00920 [archaeon]